MSLRFWRQISWRLAADGYLRTRTVATESQLTVSRFISSASTASLTSSVPYLRKALQVSRSTGLWHPMRELAAGIKKGDRPRGKLLFGGVAAFLWEKERISTNEAINCLKEYDQRMKSKLSLMLEEPTSESPTSSTLSIEMTPTSQLKQQLQTYLQNSSERNLSKLPLVGLREMGALSSASVKAGEVFHRIASKAIRTLNEAAVHIYQPVEAQLDGDVMKNEELDVVTDVRNDAEIAQRYDCLFTEDNSDSRCSEPMIQYYVERSNRHMAELPLVGLQSKGSVYMFSRHIADCVQNIFTADSYNCSRARFLKHLVFSLWDMPSLPVVSHPLTILNLDDMVLNTEGFTAASMKGAVHSAYEQGKSLLSLCASPRLLLETFDSLSGRDTDTEQSAYISQDTCVTCASQDAATNSLVEGEADIEDLSTDDYLKKGNWECFAEANNCTVYRKPHTSGLFMYKVIGRYTDISIKDFIDVQVDHSCRKQWDSYIQKLETIDTDPDTGTEVVQWVMKFPFPMSSREYVYVRRVWMNKKCAVLVNRSVTHPSVPVGRNYVRVQDYISNTVMQPHTTANEDGFEYEVTYYDDPQTNLPTSCVNWVATAAMPEFLNKIHAAAKQRKITKPRLSTIT